MQPENTKTLSDLRGIPPRSLRSRLFSASRFRNSTAVTMNLPQHPERPALKSNPPALRRLRTEQLNRSAQDLDRKSSLEIATLINAEDATVALAVTGALPQIARAIEQLTAAFRNGGHLIYGGAGTGARIATLDAVETLPPSNPNRVHFIIAGGNKALASAPEISEDNPKAGRQKMSRRKPTKNDVV